MSVLVIPIGDDNRLAALNNMLIRNLWFFVTLMGGWAVLFSDNLVGQKNFVSD